MRSSLAVVLAVLLVCPNGLLAATPSGVLQGRITVDGRPLNGIELALVDVSSGVVHKTRSGGNGEYRVDLDPGRYVVASPSGAGVAVGRGPTLVAVEAGRVASADVELVTVAGSALQATEQVAAGQGPTIVHDTISCLLSGEFPIFDARIEPAADVVRARLYFKSALGTEWFFVEMQPEGDLFRGYLPRPQLAASPVGYYFQATTTDLGESATPEAYAIVVEFEDECEDRVLAPVGQPNQALTIFSATTGAAALPAGFAAGSLALGVGTVAAIVAGAGAAVASVAITTTGIDTPTTTPLTTTPETVPPTTPTTTLPPGMLYTLSVNWDEPTGTIIVEPGAGGSCNPSTGLSQTCLVPAGERALITARDNASKQVTPTASKTCFIKWGGACGSAGSNLQCSVLMENNRAVFADFERFLFRPIFGETLECEDKRQP